MLLINFDSDRCSGDGDDDGHVDDDNHMVVLVLMMIMMAWCLRSLMINVDCSNYGDGGEGDSNSNQ